MFGKLKHFVYHSKVIKPRFGLVSKIASGYAKTLLLRRDVLRTVEFPLLTECNSKCVMCYTSKVKRQDDAYLSAAEYKDIWAQASRMGAFSAILTGGEPTLRKELFDIISVLDPQNSILALVTNSLKLDRPLLSDLKKAGIATIHMSLDSTDKEKNNDIRGASTHFDRVMNAIVEAKKLGFSVYISTVIMHSGLGKMEEMTRFAKENGIGIVFSLACVSGEWASAKDVLLTEAEWVAVQHYMKANPHVRSDWTINFSMRQECPGGREKISVSCYGDVTGCSMNPISFGNVRREPLKQLWNRIGQFPDFKRRSPDCLIGADHRYIEKYVRPLADRIVPVPIDQHPAHPTPFERLDGGPSR